MSEGERTKSDKPLDGPFESLRGALGLPSLSSQFVVDTPDVNDELDFPSFRAWFDAHRTWKPVPMGEQLSRAELRARVRVARTALAAWPRSSRSSLYARSSWGTRRALPRGRGERRVVA